MGVCAVSLVFSTGCYCVAESSEIRFSGDSSGKTNPPIAGWRKARKSYSEVLVQ